MSMTKQRCVDIYQRHQSEESFHDAWASGINVDTILVEEFFEAATAVENISALQEFGHIYRKRILDLGCGAGEASVYFASKGADVYATDISLGMLKKAGELAKKFGVGLNIFKMTAESLKFADNYFDYVFGNGVLHHCDLALAGKEISRVLKKGGKAVFIEPLSYNPVISIYRKIAKDVRTENETPIDYPKLSQMTQNFSKVTYKHFWLFSLLIFVYMFLVERFDPSKVRYWKLVIEESRRYQKAFRVLNAFDSIVLTIFPFLRRFCWNIVVVFIK